MSSSYFPETFSVYRYREVAERNALGELVAPDPTDITNLYEVGEVNCLVNLGDSLEPDVRGMHKDYGQSVSSDWIGFLDIPDGFDIYVGDLLLSSDDDTRKFWVQFLDRQPGGYSNHHYEARLQKAEVFVNG